MNNTRRKDLRKIIAQLEKIDFEEPLIRDIQAYIDNIEKEWISSNMSVKEYYVSLGKALAYTEAQFSIDMITKEKALDLLEQIKRLHTE